jgi:preprotein translocase subunit SecB
MTGESFMVSINAYKVNKLEIENRVAPGVQLKLQNQVKYNVNYMDDVKKCVGILGFRITDANLNPFEVKIEMAAEFSFGEEDEKADIHTQSFDQLFPFLRMVINNITSLTGMPGLMIPIMRLNKDNVIVGKPQEAEKSPLN